MIGKDDIKRALDIELHLSQPMTEALDLWDKMYHNKPPWASSKIKTLGIPAVVAGEFARSITLEEKFEVIAPKKGDAEGVASSSKRAEFLNEQLQLIMPAMREQIEYGNAKGGLILKPYVDGDGISVDFAQADMFFPTNVNKRWGVVDCVFPDQRKIGDVYYTRLEYHKMGSVTGRNGKRTRSVTITNAAFRSTSKDTLGTPVELSVVDDWANLKPEVTIAGVKRPLFSYYRFPQANNIDSTSPLGVSCFSRAQTVDENVSLVQHADEIYSNLIWEFESGKRAIYVDEEAFEKDTETGKRKIPDDRLYRTLGRTGNIDDKGNLFDEWTPDFRNEAIQGGLNDVLKRIEYVTNLAAGMLSDPQQVDKTATEVLSSKQRFAATVVDGQKSVKSLIDGVVEVMDLYATLYNLAPKGVYDIAYNFDDSLVTDHKEQFSQDQMMVNSGAMGKVEWRMRTFNETEETAKKMVADAQKERQAEMAVIDPLNEGL